jgi:glutamate-ammonia-ligase adenylyltransferase
MSGMEQSTSLAGIAQAVEPLGEAGAWLIRELEQLCEGLPDPEHALMDVDRFIERGARLATELRGLRANPVALQLLVQLSSMSHFGMDLVLHQQRLFWDVIQEGEYRQVWGRSLMAQGLRRQLERLENYEHRINALVRFRNYNILRIILGDIAGKLSFEAITAELSDMTDVIVAQAMELAAEKLRPRFGDPACQMVILALGKLGGRELNYSSDIDLIFVYRDRGETSGGRKVVDHHEYFKRLGAEVIKILDEHHPAGRLFRVDMRLRPEGDAGELALSFDETINYYYSLGRAWERQAMIKARAIAGELALGDRLLQDLRSWIFPAEHRIEDLDEARIMRRRIEERVSDNNVKAGAGGIRDIEFLVQYYQLTYGGRNQDLRERATLPAIRALFDAGLLSREDAALLEEDYIWLRMVEHRLQMFEARQLHDLPEPGPERCDLAYRCGFDGPRGCERFDMHHLAVRSRVRRLSEKHYLGGDGSEDALFALIDNQHLSTTTAETVLAPFGFNDPMAAAKRLRDMAREPFFILQQGRTERALVKLLPKLLPLLRITPVPDEALANIERITEAVGGRSSFFESLLNNTALREVVIDLAGWATFVVNEMTRFTGLPDEVGEHLGRGYTLGHGLLDEARKLTAGLSDPVPGLAYLKARELAVAATHDLRGHDPSEIWRRLTRLSAAVTEVLLDSCREHMVARWGEPLRGDGAVSRFAVLGLGKLGGKELAYASDMDVIFVCDAGGQCQTKPRESEEFWIRVARDLCARCEKGQLYPVDPRLRPWGDQGQLVVNPNTLAQYWSQERELWERLAMTRISVLAGDAELGAESCELIRRAALTAPLPANAAEQVRSMRLRLEQSVSGRDHLKRGWGGYVDIEFLAFYLSLGCDPDVLPAGAAVIETLECLADLGRIPAIAAQECSESLLFLRQIEARMRLMDGEAISSLPVEDAPRKRFARCAGFETTEEMNLALHVARERARYWFDALVV